MIKISSRLKKVADYVDDNSSVVDIGCDHGLLDIYLEGNKKNISIIASDINQNALNNARRNISKYKLDKKIKLVLSDGLSNIDTSSVDVIVIAGMGSHTMVSILQKNIRKLKKVKTLILQSNNDLDFLRYKVVKLGYFIKGEELVRDGKFIYSVIKFQRGYRFYTWKDYYLGFGKRDELWIEKVKVELEKNRKIYSFIPPSHYLYRLKVMRRIRVLAGVLRDVK